ncbi:unnamed protein product [Schistosoma turkestanicum]|nr:unnamed protein product [Schistosoma turkestanicum]
MKVKELEKFAHSAWSPLSCSRTYLATVTAEDNREPTGSNINTSSNSPTLDIYEFNVKENNLLSMQVNISMPIKQKATCLLWTAPINNSHLDNGLLISGSSSGSLYLYDSQKLISLHENTSSSRITTTTTDHHINQYTTLNHVHSSIDKNHENNDFATISQQSASICISENDVPNYLYTSRENIHQGVVRSLDFNRFQTNLFASASNDEEIFIWDIEKMEQPMSPGAKIQPLENVNQVAWNPRVQHILCTTNIGRCVIWDLRKSGPVLQLTKTMCQLEPQMMAWSPTIATRLCLTDPNNPNGHVQLWDLRYPKHMLCLLSHWPPPLSSTLGNTGTVNALYWGIPDTCTKSQLINKSNLYDHDMILLLIGATGSTLPAINDGHFSSKFNPIYAEFLTVWSVDQALNNNNNNSHSTTMETNIHGSGVFEQNNNNPTTPQPIFISRLEGFNDQELANPFTSCYNTSLPSNASVQWIPNYPNLVCVTQSDGWITVLNLSSGLINKQTEPVNIERYTKQCVLARNSSSLGNSHKVAEAFDNAVDDDDDDDGVDGERSLITFSHTTTNDNISSIQSMTNIQSDTLYPVLMNGENVNDMIDLRLDQLGLNERDHVNSISLSLPQPMPLLRTAPIWLKRPCGVHFAFGGRLVTFSSHLNHHHHSKRTRTTSSMSNNNSNAKHTEHHHHHHLNKSSSSDIGHNIQHQHQHHHDSTTVTPPTSLSSDQHHLNSSNEINPSNRVCIQWIGLLQLEPSTLSSSSSSAELNPSSSLNNNNNNNNSDDMIYELNVPWKHSFEAIIQCFINVINCSDEYLSGICENAQNLFNPMLDNTTSTTTNNHDDSSNNNNNNSDRNYLNLWNVIQARLDKSNSVKSSLSSLLGYRKQEFQDFNDLTFCQLLDALKYALVMNDAETVIQLCMHPKLASISLPNLSTLNIFALMLSTTTAPTTNTTTDSTSTRFNQPELYDTVRMKLAHQFHEISLQLQSTNSSTIMHDEPIHLKSILLLLLNIGCGGVVVASEFAQTAWFNLIEHWPLNDWTSILTVMINYLLDKNNELCRKLCSTLAKRLLDTSNSSLDNGLAACICYIISDNFDEFTKCWLQLNSLNEINVSNMPKCLPLALLLLFLYRSASSSSTTTIINPCTDNDDQLNCKLLLTLSIWLIEFPMDNSQLNDDDRILLSFNLLAKILPTVQFHSSQSTLFSLNEFRHRVWCNLTSEQQQQQLKLSSMGLQQHHHQQPQLLCPYPLIQCHCGLPKLHSFNKIQPTNQQLTLTTNQFQQSQQSVLTCNDGLLNNKTIGQNQSILNISPPINVAHNANVPPSFTSPVCSNVYPPLNLPPTHLTNQQSSIVTPPMPNAFNNNNYTTTNHISSSGVNSNNYPPMKPCLQSNTTNLIEFNAVDANSMSTMMHKPPLPPPIQPAQMYTNVEHHTMYNRSTIQHPSFQPINNMPYTAAAASGGGVGMSTPPAPFNVQHQQPQQPPHEPQQLVQPLVQSAGIPPPLLPPPAPAPAPPLQQQQQHQRQSSVISPGWNDPPILSNDKPRQSSVSHNPYYNPMEFANSPIIPQPTNVLSSNSITSNPSLPPNSNVCYPAAAMPLLNPNLICTQQPIQQQFAPSSLFMQQPQQPPLPPSYSQVQGGGVAGVGVVGVVAQHQHEQYQSSIGPSSQFSPRLPSSSVASSDVWPIAQPLCTTTTTSTTVDTTVTPIQSDLNNQTSIVNDNLSTNSVNSLSTHNSLPIEFQHIQNVLNNLIQNCRDIGSKQYHHKLTDIEQRLNQFFINISTGQLQLIDLSMEYLQNSIHSIELNDYCNALQQINTFIQSSIQLPNIQCYGPALKMLIQLAQQLSLNKQTK